MPMQAVVENLETIEETIRGFYVEGEDGKFHLDLDDSIKSHKGVTPLANAFARQKEDGEKAKQRADKLAAEIAELRKGAPDSAALQAKLSEAAELAEAQKKAAEVWQAKYLGVTKDGAIKAALGAKGIIDPSAQHLAALAIGPMVEVTENGEAIGKDAYGNPVTLAKFLDGWLAKDGAVLAPKPVGVGATGGDKTGGGGAISRSNFDLLSPVERTKFLQSGGTVSG